MAPANQVVRFIMPDEYILITLCSDSSPITCGWEGGSALASDKKMYATKVVTRKEYMEHGSNICSTRLDTPKSLQESGGKDIIENEDMY
jgi:hypothetical protein